MKKIISLFFLFITAYAHAGVDIYSNDTTILGLERNERANLTTSTLLGGGAMTLELHLWQIALLNISLKQKAKIMKGI